MARANRQTAGEETGKARSLANLTGGSRKGIPNKTTTQLKEAILAAAEKAGGEDGLIGYLVTQAEQNPQSFLSLLGKVLPLQVAGDAANPVVVLNRVEIVPLT